ncbi:Ribosomal protein S25 [Spraguea lophii 42_110]|uniref:40S ribosomal protein S25 n=1 Tax=Spraguea lophii (strain 42_110) TaxID=1358809 RepID=S7WAV8_SPRLO|nr:Chain SZ0, 40S ribosomal protein S25 [Spraguea lophii 42_110]7QJH_RZ0 Chain RZ0, 40S ribosomal protein S25 [Spraguea lophii 42_110]7QJH_SZ0 Chain SZ0, 40S ribosomal protein S25 [Spraguea lophii 42_110]8BR3_SZ0 Chain SZ0, 40S ribosomal protein S25 [Spraguea lophii 42_110]8P5D_SZ0 Chain SZ0, 40S ribosomal protein S25 [Spraguea lophii 42_110]8P60_RZ0 Chain RZ0, 40S ribosomal protein S25 [Spraguea lophii 42_110]8P60_SZ0 Chain SZ0, 40S ribosomal protein S25 [Spraguea lophii 42_110]EPR80056.1 R
MAKKVLESKTSKAEKISNSTKSKKKWSSGKVAEAVKRHERVEDDIFNKIVKDVKNMRILTRTTLSERYNLSLNISIKLLRFLEENQIIKLISSHRGSKIYAGSKYEPLKVVEQPKEVEATVDNDQEWA